METFKIEVKETLSRTVEIKASNVSKAFEKVNQLYKSEKIVLDYNDHCGTDIDIKDLTVFTNNDSFSNFVLKTAEGMIANLSVEELAKIGFGSLNDAILKFSKEKK